MADWGLKVSRTGAAIDSSDLRDYVLHSKYKTFKAKARATTTMTWVGGAGTASKAIAHGLGYAPFYFVTLEGYGNKWYNIIGDQYLLVTATKTAVIYAYSDPTNLNIYGYSSDPPASNTVLNITYYIIIDDLNG